MKMNILNHDGKAKIIAAGFVLALLASCSNSFLDKNLKGDSPADVQKSLGTLNIILSDTEAPSRTILPVPLSAADISTYNVTLTKSGSETKSETKLENLSAPIKDIPPGEWNLTVSGHNADGTKIAEGSKSITIAAGSNTAALSLLPVLVRTAGGKGKLRVTFAYTGDPSDIRGFDVLVASVPDKIAVAIPAGNITNGVPGTIEIQNTEIPSGTYLLTLYLYQDSAKTVRYAPVCSIVQIYDNRTSSATLSCTAANLTHPPASPSNFRVTGFDGANMTLQWDDNSNVEESFILSMEGMVDTPLAAGSTETTIMPPAGNKNIKLKARNIYGDSADVSFSYIAVLSLALNKKTILLPQGQTTPVIATLLPPEASLQPFVAGAVTWSSGSANAGVNAAGTITGYFGATIPNLAIITGTLGSLTATVEVNISNTGEGFDGGEGTEANPYIVGTPAGLNRVRYARKAFFAQSAVINMQGFSWMPIGDVDTEFEGTYNGAGYSILNLYFSDPGQNYAGLFGRAIDADIRNIVLIGANITGAQYVGALLGQGTNTKIYRCGSIGNVQGDAGSCIGGLVGELSSGQIDQCYSNALVSGNTKLGGLIGASSAIINNCYATGSVTGASDEYQIAGLVGNLMGGSINKSYAIGVVKMNTTSAQGFAGYNGATCTGCFWDQVTSAALTTYIPGPVGKTTAKMISQSTFTAASWDFTSESANGTDDIWTIQNGDSYPYLTWQGAPNIPSPGYQSALLGTLRYVPAGAYQRDTMVTNISIVTAPFRISTREITRMQFEDLFANEPSNQAFSTGSSDPIQNVNWYQAIAFCNKLSIAEGLTPVYTVAGVTFSSLLFSAIPITPDTDWNNATANWAADGYRLPTEMEWMWAAMGATGDRSNGYAGSGTNTTGYTKGYAGSLEAAGAQVNIADYAWYTDNSLSKTHPAGSKLPNELGLYDMSGNAWEWCWDWYDANYTAGTLQSSTSFGPASGTYRVARGGSRAETASNAKVDNRGVGVPDGQNVTFGFRVVRP